MAMPPMFGCVIPGRLAQFEAQTVSETELLFIVQECDSVNHVVVFLTGSQPLPAGVVAGIYLHWPKPTPGWFLLGHITNQKPSAIYKIAKPKDNAVTNMFTGMQAGMVNNTTAQIGISLEPQAQIGDKTPATISEKPSTSTTFVEFTQKMLTNVFNYCSSFARKQCEMTPEPNESFVPMSSLQKWYETFQRRMTMDPNFWKSL